MIGKRDVVFDLNDNRLLFSFFFWKKRGQKQVNSSYELTDKRGTKSFYKPSDEFRILLSKPQILARSPSNIFHSNSIYELGFSLFLFFFFFFIYIFLKWSIDAAVADFWSGYGDCNIRRQQLSSTYSPPFCLRDYLGSASFLCSW